MNALLKHEELLSIEKHPKSQRLYQIILGPEVIEQFIQTTATIDPQILTYLPLQRFVIAKNLDNATQGKLGKFLRYRLHDRYTGGFTLGIDDTIQLADRRNFNILLSTAIAHLIGVSNFDAMAANYYATFSVKHTDNSDSFLRQAYRKLTMHTDGTYVNEATDFLLMMKLAEENAHGGESRLLHLDDWQAQEKFNAHYLSRHQFKFQGTASKNVDKPVYKPVFSDTKSGVELCFIDQFIFPETIEEALFLHKISESIENEKHILEIALPVNHMVVINNHFWMHGRSAFTPHTELHRELLRQRGHFFV